MPEEITFTSGQTSQTFTFTATDDTEDDDDETVLLAFGASLPDRVSPGTLIQTIVRITDNDAPEVTVSFSEPAYTVPEGGSQTITVTLSADPERTVTIPLTVMNQDGASSDDYSSMPVNLTFNERDTSKSFPFTATDDFIDDDGESVLLAFGELPERVSAGTTATVNIDDDDGAGISVSKASLPINEGSSGTYTISLDSEPTAGVTITVNDPRSNTDVTAEPDSLTFSANDWNSPKTVTARAAHDEDALDETATVTHSITSTDSKYNEASANSVIVTVTDDDDPRVVVSFGQPTHTVDEGNSITVTVTLDTEPERIVVIPLTATEENNATSGDYSVQNSVTFAPDKTSQTFTFTASDDEEDDDDESVLMTFGSNLPHRVDTGAANQARVNIRDDDDPEITVYFGANTYAVPEGGTATITLTLSADPERTVEIPITATGQNNATPADYSVPTSVTFTSGQTSQTLIFNATQDDVDDDNERVLLTFGALPERVSKGTPNEARVNIGDDDDPHVTVMFGQSAYAVTEGSTITVRVTLSADPERTVIIPITVMNKDGASSDDYSSLPSSITINANEMSKTLDFMATEDETPDRGESVLLSIGTNLPARVTRGTPDETTVTINQAAGQFSLDCSLPAAVWCAELEFSQDIALNWGWIYLRHSDGWDPPSRLSNKNFHFRDMNYDAGNMELKPGTHPVMPNTWSKFHQGFSSFRMQVYRSHGPRRAPSETHYRDWVLHLDGLQMPFKDALQFENQFTWVTPDIQEAFENWSPATATLIGIEKVPAANQGTNPLLPWAPMQVDASPEGPNRLRIDWAKPAWYSPGLPNPTAYIVQWKPASENWSNSAAVAQQEIRAESHFHHLIVDGLTEGSLYSVRVIASNNAGDGPPSLETIGQPHGNNTALTARTMNGNTLTLHFSERLDPNSVPKTTDFVVMMDGGLLEVDSVAIIGNEVVLTLNQSVTAANSVRARYEKPTDPAAVFLQDTQGKHVQIPRRLGLLSAHNTTPQSSVQPLTAAFQNVPDSHDGETTLTLDIEFSEPVWVGAGLSRNGMLEVTGGTVISAPWRNNHTDGITIHIRPDTNGDILIVLPGNRVCTGIISSGAPMTNAAPGAPCAIRKPDADQRVHREDSGPSVTRASGC